MKASSGQESRPTRSSGVSLERRVNYSRRHCRARWYLRRRPGSENARLQELEPDRTLCDRPECGDANTACSGRCSRDAL